MEPPTQYSELIHKLTDKVNKLSIIHTYTEHEQVICDIRRVINYYTSYEYMIREELQPNTIQYYTFAVKLVCRGKMSLQWLYAYCVNIQKYMSVFSIDCLELMINICCSGDTYDALAMCTAYYSDNEPVYQFISAIPNFLFFCCGYPSILSIVYIDTFESFIGITDFTNKVNRYKCIDVLSKGLYGVFVGSNSIV
jgi:hypothetical protein